MPGMRITNAREWRSPCPVHNGKDLNFAVSSETGLSQCHSQCGRGWDIISLEQELGVSVRWVETEARNTSENASLSAPLLKAVLGALARIVPAGLPVPVNLGDNMLVSARKPL